MAKGFTFKSGNCFMTAPLNRRGVEYVGEALSAYAAVLALQGITGDLDDIDIKFHSRRFEMICKALDHPQIEIPDYECASIFEHAISMIKDASELLKHCAAHNVDYADCETFANNLSDIAKGLNK